MIFKQFGVEILSGGGFVTFLENRIQKTYKGHYGEVINGQYIVDGELVSNHHERYIAVCIKGANASIASDHHQKIEPAENLCRDDEFLLQAIRAYDNHPKHLNNQ